MPATLGYSLDFLSTEYLCLNDGSSSDENSDDESCMTVKGNLHELEILGISDSLYHKRRNFCWGLIFMGKHIHEN